MPSHPPHQPHQSHAPHRTRRARRLGATVLAALVAVTLWAGPAVTPSAQQPTSGDGVTAAVSISPATSTAIRRVSLANARAWPRGVVTWSASVPRRYRWSVEHGVRAWNRTHTGVRFVKRPAAEARLHISMGYTGGASAVATVGFQRRGNRVTLSRLPIKDWRDRQVYGRVVTHELGHVLGLEHSQGLRCGLMEAKLDKSCIPAPAGGQYACRWIEPEVGNLVTRRYGGSFTVGPRRCSLRG